MDVIESSAGTAWLVSRKVEGIQVFGGLVLNTNYGGMNPRAVKSAMYYGAGAKFVSFGAHSTRHIADSEGKMVDGKPALFRDIDPEFFEEEYSRVVSIPLEGPPSPALDKILRTIAENEGVYLNTGHISGSEGLRLVELPGTQECCGFGGVFSVEHPQISAAMLERKLDNLLLTQAPVVVACDAGCITNINGGLHRRRLPQRAVHIAEVLAETQRQA